MYQRLNKRFTLYHLYMRCPPDHAPYCPILNFKINVQPKKLLALQRLQNVVSHFKVNTFQLSLLLEHFAAHLYPCWVVRYIAILKTAHKNNVFKLTKHVFLWQLVKIGLSIVLSVRHRQLLEGSWIVPLFNKPHPSINQAAWIVHVAQVRTCQADISVHLLSKLA